MDLFGAALVLIISLVRSFHTTIYYQGAIQFDIPVDQLWSYFMLGAYPLGILSTIGAVFSLLSTRLVGKQNNWGNFIGILTTINSGTNDYLFDNRSAVITYPLTFLITTFGTYNWTTGIKLRDRDLGYYIILGVSMVVAYILVFLGFHLFGGRQDWLFANVVAITFGLSLGANFCSALKYKETWWSWVIYNIVQLLKNALQANLANVVKYIFYLFNAAITLIDWRFNGDRRV